MPEAKTKRAKATPAHGRVITFDEDAFWIGMAAKVTGRTQAEFVRDELRKAVRSVLIENGVDPDRAFAKSQAASRN